ncbi:Glycosyl transferases group 1 [Caballeronia terrestris]|uniref:Glycosyl transferases group 1 n=1 Tax=Caballeronia terrestris TaxID=1226301 RepID=A0A158HVG9_9BURK|nr:glycosyltransferase [Caballeronia terrestris]SAL48394.1 Glycosyl transferases group 1 [Caballeronia terrestris]
MINDTVLIIEPNFSGHRWRYAEWAANAYMEAGYRCVIVTEPSNASHPLVARLQAEDRAELQIALVAPPERSGRRGLSSISYARFHQDFRHAYDVASRGRGVALVVVPYVDYFFLALPFLGSPFGATPWVGITMRSNFHHDQVGVRAPRRPLVNAAKTQLFMRAIRTRGLKTLLTIDPTLAGWWTDIGHRGLNASAAAAAIEYLADPFPDARAAEPELAKARLGLGSGKHVLVYGAINDRKGIFELAAALAARPASKEAPTLVIAGAQDEEVRASLKAATSKLVPAPVVLDRFISIEAELDLFSACDVVWLGYKGHYGMSGVLVQAYRFGKPVIATADGLIGWFCRTGELGPVVDDLSVASINRALDVVLAGVPHATPGAQHLLERNTLSQFKKTLRQAVI